MKQNRVWIVLLALAGAAIGNMSEADAACTGNSCKDEKIERLYIRSGGEVAVSTTGPETNLTCTPVENTYLILNRSHPAFREIFSTLLSSKLANHDIWIRVSTTASSPCSIVYVVLE